jgi:hypothetical protein
MNRRIVILAMALALVGAACGGDGRSGPLLVPDPTASDYDYDYDIPLGTGERFDNGEDIDIIPAELVVSVGEVLRIVNHDERDALIGPFFVGAGETLVQRFTAPGEFTGLCTVHPSGEFVLKINP